MDSPCVVSEASAAKLLVVKGTHQSGRIPLRSSAGLKFGYLLESKSVASGLHWDTVKTLQLPVVCSAFV